MSTAVTKSDVSNLPAKASPSLLSRMAAKYSVDPSKMLMTLKSTCFKGNVSDEQMVALCIVAEQFGLNPFTKEIYAFPDKNNGIVPVVGVDGWVRIVNSNPNFESMTFEDGPLDEKDIPQWIACTIHLKNRTQPMVIKEWFVECVRNTGPWTSHPRRMLRHKAMVQCARLALGYVGIYDPDEAERVANAIDVTPSSKPKTTAPRSKQIRQETTPADSGEVERISADQLTALNDRLHEEGIPTSELLARFEIGVLEELAAVNYAAAQQAISELCA